jgi:hypothetical protein
MSGIGERGEWEVWPENSLPVAQAWADAVVLSAMEVADTLNGLAQEDDIDRYRRVLFALVKSYSEKDAATVIAIQKLEGRIAALEAAAAGLDGTT